MMPEVAERADRPRATITSDAGVHGPKMEVPRYADYRKYVDRDVEKKPISTTMGAVRMLSQLVKDKQIGKNIVPIVPESRELRHGRNVQSSKSASTLMPASCTSPPHIQEEESPTPTFKRH